MIYSQVLSTLTEIIINSRNCHISLLMASLALSLSLSPSLWPRDKPAALMNNWINAAISSSRHWIDCNDNALKAKLAKRKCEIFAVVLGSWTYVRPEMKYHFSLRVLCPLKGANDVEKLPATSFVVCLSKRIQFQLLPVGVKYTYVCVC